jgi:hypothetical protein
MILYTAIYIYSLVQVCEVKERLGRAMCLHVQQQSVCWRTQSRTYSTEVIVRNTAELRLIAARSTYQRLEDSSSIVIGLRTLLCSVHTAMQLLHYIIQPQRWRLDFLIVCTLLLLQCLLHCCVHYMSCIVLFKVTARKQRTRQTLQTMRISNWLRIV